MQVYIRGQPSYPGPVTIFFLFFRPTDSDGALTPLLWFAVPKPIARARVVRGASLISAFVSRLARNTAFYTVYLFFYLYFDRMVLGFTRTPPSLYFLFTYATNTHTCSLLAPERRPTYCTTNTYVSWLDTTHPASQD